MKGRTPTADEKRWMSKVRSLGCLACHNMGIETPEEYTLIHHVEGKTKPGAHFKVLPLCDGHHSRYTCTGLHNNPTRWQQTHGDQDILLEQVKELLND